MSDGVEKPVSLADLSELREQTETVSQFLQQQLRGHLETIRPLLAPRRVLGKYAGSGSKEEVVGADKAFNELRERYREVCGKPFGLAPELEAEHLEAVQNRLELYPWQYACDVKTPKETRTVILTSPVRWVLGYHSEYSPHQVTEILAGKEERSTDHLRNFVVDALVLQLVLSRHPGIMRLLDDLRYATRIEKTTGLGDLPVVTISSCVPSFRPPDDVIVAATRLSGVAAFIELIDASAIRTLQDPLRTKIEELLR